MSEEEIERLRNELSELEDESYKELRRQMDLLAADETMDDAQKEAFYAKIREELAEMTKHRDVIARKLQKTNELIDEVETRLKETEQYDKKKKKKLRILPPAPTNAQIDYREKQEAHFAQGITFYKLFWVFFIGCFAGVVLETLYCLIQRGHYESRVGLIYGPFNLVYGIGALCLTGALYRFRNRGASSRLSAVFWSVRSWNTPVRGFGNVFRLDLVDYSNMPFNLNGESACCIPFSGVFWAFSGLKISIRAWQSGF